VLVLPAEASPTIVAGCLEHRHLDKLAAHAGRLAIGNGKNGVAVYSFNKPIAQRIERSAEGTHLVPTQNALLDRSVNRPVINQRATGMVNEVRTVEVPSP